MKFFYNPIKSLKEAIHLYDDMWYTRKVKNSSAFTNDIPAKAQSVGVDFHAFYDGYNISYVYVLEELPNHLNLNFKERLRRQCVGDVRLNFVNHIRRHKIEWESSRMRSRLNIMRSEEKRRREEQEGMGDEEYTIHDNISINNRTNRIKKSLRYFATADKDEGNALLKNTITVIISGKKGVDMDESVVNIEKEATKLGIKLERVLYNIPEHLESFSPFIRARDSQWNRNLPTHILTDELVSRFNAYEQGKLGKRGMCFGLDIESNFPVLKVVKSRDDSAEIWLVVAETGGGKSYAVKDMILQLLGLNFRGTIMDVEGFEYKYIGDFIEKGSKVVRINMAEGSGNYFDAIEIPKLTGVDEIDSSAKNLAINFTSTTFMALLGDEGNRDSYYTTIITDAISDVYKQAGVTEEPQTWQNSKGYTYFDVYRMIKSYRVTKKEKPPEYHLILDKLLDLLGRYFEEGGARASVFKSRIRIEDIMDSDLVICSFGMAGKSEDSIDKVQLNLMQLSAAQISHQRSIFSFSEGLFNFKVWEEIQRWGEFKGAKETLGVAITGGRKLGDVNIVVTNAVSKMLKEDTFSILQNYTSFMVGAVVDHDVRVELCRRLSVPEMTDELHKIAKSPKPRGDEDDSESEINKNSIAESRYTYAFLMGLDRIDYGVVKFINPPDISNSKLFKTGVDQSRNRLKRGTGKKEILHKK